MARPRSTNFVPDSIAARLHELFNKVHPADRGPFTADEVAELTKKTAYPAVSPSYINQLLRGTRDNPTVNTLGALAEVFHVPVGYFFNKDVAEEVQANIALTAAVRDSGIQDLVNRSVKMSPAGRRSLAAMITAIQELENAKTHGGETATPRDVDVDSQNG